MLFSSSLVDEESDFDFTQPERDEINRRPSSHSNLPDTCSSDENPTEVNGLSRNNSFDFITDYGLLPNYAVRLLF
jgi:hypothetical protein